MISYGECWRGWLEEQLKTTFPDGSTFIAREVPGAFGVVCITNWVGHNCEMHYAGHGPWITRAMARAVFGYVFNELGCERVTGLVEADLAHVLDVDQRLGFKVEGRMRRGAPNGGDLVILGMLRDECRWIHHGKEHAKAATDAESAVGHQRGRAGEPRGPDQPLRICDVSDWSERDQCGDAAVAADAGAGRSAVRAREH